MFVKKVVIEVVTRDGKLGELNKLLPFIKLRN